MATCSTGQIKFFRKNHIDLDRPNPELTVTDLVAINNGQAATKFLRNRDNNSGWRTTDSTDAANTELLIDLKDYQDITDVMLIKHNFKDFLVEYYDVSSAMFLTYENVVGNTKTTNVLNKETAINTNQIKITITATMQTDEDKSMRQLIITEKFGAGQLESFPVIKNPKSSLNKKVNKLLGGRVNVVETRGSYSASLNVKFLRIDQDLEMIECIFWNREGVLMLLSGGNEDQFFSKRIGYRDEDIVLVRPTNELELPYNAGVYTNGIKIKMNVQEVVF